MNSSIVGKHISKPHLVYKQNREIQKIYQRRCFTQCSAITCTLVLMSNIHYIRWAKSHFTDKKIEYFQNSSTKRAHFGQRLEARSHSSSTRTKLMRTLLGIAIDATKKGLLFYEYEKKKILN